MSIDHQFLIPGFSFIIHFFLHFGCKISIIESRTVLVLHPLSILYVFKIPFCRSCGPVFCVLLGKRRPHAHPTCDVLSPAYGQRMGNDRSSETRLEYGQNPGTQDTPRVQRHPCLYHPTQRPHRHGGVFRSAPFGRATF